MALEHEWIYDYDYLTVNNKKYYFRCDWCLSEKAKNSMFPSMKLSFAVWNDTDKCWLKWVDFKGTYLAEKMTDYVKNSINGQRVVYWDNSKERSFE